MGLQKDWNLYESFGIDRNYHVGGVYNFYREKVYHKDQVESDRISMSIVSNSLGNQK